MEADLEHELEDERDFLEALRGALSGPDPLTAALVLTLRRVAADSGTIHLLDDDGMLRLAAHGPSLPPAVLATIATIPVGKGMAGLAVERRAPVTACNLQTDDTGDVRPGARETGLQGSIVVPILRGAEAIGALGVANRTERDFGAAETALLVTVGRAIAEHAPR